MPPRSDAPGHPSGKATRPVNKKATVLRLLKYMMKFKWLLLLALSLTIIANTLALVGPRLAGDAVDIIAHEDPAHIGTTGVDFPAVGKLVLLMLLVYLLSSALNYVLQLLMVRISRRVTMRMRDDLFVRLSDMPVGFAMALAQNEPAMERYSALSDAGKQGMLNRARLVKSKDEMDNLIASLAAAPLTGKTIDGD